MALLPFSEPLRPLVDIGVNLTDKAFAKDLPEVLEKARLAGVTGMLLTGTDVQTSEAALQLVEEDPLSLRSTAGVHPHQASCWNDEVGAHIRALLKSPNVAAVGETGLDFNRNFSTPEEQKKAFEAQLELAAETGKPLFIHERDAGETLLDILKSWRDDLAGGVVHCFTGERKSLFGYLDLDLYVGFTGWICDERRGTHLWPLLPSIPEQRLLIETDAPWLLPRTLKPKPKKGRNEPAYLPWVLAKLAEIRQQAPAQLALQTSRNAQTLFNLPDSFLMET
ncbi:TatD DNase family protein [Marinospirillum celere]|uniref:TatD DNase family protein n=1 Tax=Marinospirillum celere TaxID=1122252 RepID=A0A1I1GRH5_9GAMM|nr:TatD family hydrolase [Marinospirillum celere]SFC12468.1 TatD DNase family protein [Marinospirillum celere]